MLPHTTLGKELCISTKQSQGKKTKDSELFGAESEEDMEIQALCWHDSPKISQLGQWDQHSE